ncbi:MAG TPA: acetyl-CoA carboxylase biotin carboxyl carrier protein subunit [Bacteroidales bacterium]|nr:acetyl-CoA carboxylase biotin carboxyl carrier protein subunit [Bacteroidales bacterium]
MEAKEAAAAAKGETEEEVKPQEPVELIDFAVTARKYKTQLTKKYKERKFWVDPSPYEIVSYIPGTIISVDVKEKRVVKEGEQLLILEAMKMQNRVDMPFTARIKKINVKVGEKVPKDFVMIELEPAD